MRTSEKEYETSWKPTAVLVKRLTPDARSRRLSVVDITTFRCKNVATNEPITGREFRKANPNQGRQDQLAPGLDVSSSAPQPI
jgi:hypothetical protein